MVGFTTVLAEYARGHEAKIEKYRDHICPCYTAVPLFRRLQPARQGKKGRGRIEIGTSSTNERPM